MTADIDEIPNLLNKFKHKSNGYVKFNDVDAFRVVYNLKYLEWTEIARVEYCQALGISVIPTKNNITPYAVYIVHSEANFFNPATFFDNYVVHTRVCKLGRTSITFEHIVTLEDKKPLCINQAVNVYTGSDNRPVPIDDYIKKAIISFEGNDLEITSKGV